MTVAASGWDGFPSRPRLLAVEYFERVVDAGLVVDDRPESLHHGDRVLGLPDVPTHVDALRPEGDGVVGELERLAFRVELGSAGDHERHRARLHDLLEPVAIVGL